MNREGKKCVLYPRVSTEMQVDGYSLEGQKNSLKRFADREEMEIVGIYEDAGKSGKSIEGRPAFKKMLSDIKNGLEIDYILVYKLSRFGRNAADILNSLEFVQSYGINLICIEEGIDSSQTSGKLLISVLSAVAEIERENIIEQTMNGRREKARQGGWNGGFAPYGYYLKDNQLLIEETEAEAIRIIFDKFANSDVGLGGVAKYLNLQGIKKIPRQNGTLETWSSHFIRLILDNPVYCGKIAYGRRTREKVKGTKNEYKQVHTDDYILEDGQHEGIVSEELWQKAHTKRMATGIKQPSKIGKDRSHLLTGILKCPICGSSMYTNKHAWTNKDGTYKEVYYYICGRNKQERGHHCDYKASLRKTDIEPLVIEAVKELVSDKYFAKEIEKRIGVQTDTTAIDKELANYESKLKEVDLNKARLEREIDNLPIDARFRERKIHDMTLRLDGLYDTIVELEERIEDAKLRRSSIEMEAITLDNIYKLMLNFGKLYDIISDEEKKNLITYLIKEIQIYPNGESEMPLKSIEFNFPIYRDGQEVRRLLWEKGNTVDTDGHLEKIPAQTWELVERILAKQLFVEASRQDKPFETAEDILMHLLDGGFSSAAYFQLQAANTYLADFHPRTFALVDLTAYRSVYAGKRRLKEALEARLPDSHPFLYKGDVFLFLHEDEDAQSFNALAEEFHLKVLISEPLDELFDLPKLYPTAREALELMRDERFHGERVCSAAQLRIPLLLKNLEGRGGLISIELRRLAAHDREKNTQYCETLYYYLICCRSLKKTCDALYTHRNTVLYRIRRLQEDFDISLDDPSLHADLLLGVSLILFETKGPDFFLHTQKNEA